MAEKIVGGDLDKEVADMTKDEIGQSVNTFYQMIKHLKETTVSSDKKTEEVAVITKDEIGQLENVFNQIIRHFEETTVSSDELIEEVSERKQAEELLKTSNQHLSSTAAGIKSLMENIVNVTPGEDGPRMVPLMARYDNDTLIQCWENKKCGKVDCISYENEENLRCWELAGTFCGGEVQGKLAQKLGNCRKCEVYQSARGDSLHELGETFNEMIIILNDRQIKLIEEESATQALQGEIMEHKQTEERLHSSNQNLQQLNEQLSSTAVGLKSLMDKIVNGVPDDERRQGEMS